MLIVNDDPFGKFGLGVKRLWRRGAVPLVIGACCFAFALGGDAARDWGTLRPRRARGRASSGDSLTAHLVHLGWARLWPNLLALLLIGGLLEEFLSPLEWAVATVWRRRSRSARGAVPAPDPDAHRGTSGLSGVLHGLRGVRRSS